MHQSTLLYSAADCSDGVPRSFPIANKSDVVRKYSYALPNKDYKKLFFCRATISRLQRNEDAPQSSAGQLVPSPNDDDSCALCKPVFITNSLLLAIQLLRETLLEGTLSNNSQSCLVKGAQVVVDEGVLAAPPSAQQLVVSSLLENRKRRTSSLALHPSKSARAEEADNPAASLLLSNNNSVLEA